jgi:uncharacterized protein (TIGR00255 family)
MTKSMTAFARAEHGAAIWEIRSVNHRYLDTSFRLPDNVRYLETALKGAFKDLVYRGKLECTLKINASELNSSIQINTVLVQSLSEALAQISDLSGIENRGDALGLMRWPDVLETVEQTDELELDIQRSFKAAVKQLVAMREREGTELASLIESRLKEIESIVKALHEEAPLIIENQHEKLHARIAKLDLEVDEARLETELVILAQKLDVMEELDRLTTHVSEVRRSLSLDEPVGRRLDFLMQELNREANTISSKAAVSSTTLQAVDLKVIIEQIREQIQNIE